MADEGPSSSRKRQSSPSANLTAADHQRPKLAKNDPDVIDLTEDDIPASITHAATIPASGTRPAEQAPGASGSHNSSTIDSPLHLFRVRGIPNWANEGFLGVKLGDLVSGPMQWALVSNYMIDFPWLLSACPDLVSCPSVLVCHGESGGRAIAIQRAAIDAGMNGRVSTFLPNLPSYGTHHSKYFLLQYARGFRVIIHTANLLYCDANNKTQGLFYQDFPLKDDQSTLSSPFERDLLDYITALQLPPKQATKVVDIIKLHDFSAARIHLIASVPSGPSEFSGSQTNSYGYLKLKSCLENEPGGFPENFKGAPIVCQYSSIGNLSTKWLESFINSLSAGTISSSEASTSELEKKKHSMHGNTAATPGSRPLAALGPPGRGAADTHLIWPTIEEVQNSVEGWFAGGSIPGHPDKVRKDFLQQYYRRFSGRVTGRQRAMPHMKSYTRFDPGTHEIAWFCVASHNLSKAAWGEQQESRKFNRQIFKIFAYELGVLMVPSLEKAYRCSRHYGFSCTDHIFSQKKVGPMAGSENLKQVKFVQWQKGESQSAGLSPDGTVLTVPLPVPYPLPPDSYNLGTDVPWDCQNRFPGLDSFGMPHPGIGSHYMVKENQEWGDVIDALKHGAERSLKEPFG